MGNFYTDVAERDPRFRSPQACYDPALLEPHFRAAMQGLIAAAATIGETLHWGETFRSPARQLYLRSKGLSQLTTGFHCFTFACDLSRIINGRYDPTGKNYAFLRRLCAAAPPLPWGNRLVWGGDWGDPNMNLNDTKHFHDWDHVQALPNDCESRLFDKTTGKWTGWWPQGAA